ncbi:MAG TPA: URC4/urg3 family protein [Polyangiaceae bacterium]|nr:URC4/urg3 family protein [Polyangiaceae bacterium]
MSVASSEQAEYEYLQTTRAIRERCERVFEAARAGELEHWLLDEGKLPEVATRVAKLTQHNYPDLTRIPYHGRYRHFDVGGVPRLSQFDAKIAGFSREEQLAARFELVITSVLLDAGAGATWRYRALDGASYTRSEGLAVASYELFLAGTLGGSRAAPRADAVGLTGLSARVLGDAFQVSDDNPLTGLEGRAALLRRLGDVVALAPEYFGSSERARLGNLGVWLLHSARDGRLEASAILAVVLRELGPIWRGRPHLAGHSLGDVWPHSRFGFVPFHKLSQWLSYSLFEPLEAAGLTIVGADALTGLAEYRNGGLYFDAGVLNLRDPNAAERVHAASSDLVIEWRALTVALLDRTAALVQKLLGVGAETLPLARVLEGGTWRAGRAIALERRSDGRPPLQIDSDGTVF